MLQLEEAVQRLCRAVRPVTRIETLPLLEALGSVLAEDCTAPEDQPPFPRSPLDGYALRGADSTQAAPSHPVTLRVIGKVCAGEVFSGTVGPGEAVRIMTGAPIPEDADTVIRQEDTDYGEETVSLYCAVTPYENYCPAGEDYKKGSILMKKGTLVTASAVSLLAAAGWDTVPVLCRPRVAVISTGDEVLQLGTPLRPGTIYDSNRYYITARLRELGCPPIDSLHCSDDSEALAAEIRRLAPDTDLILTTGGVSVGEKDILHRTLELLGAERLFWKVAVKPGSPTLAGVFEDTLLLCLSGNPYGAVVHFELLARPVLEELSGDQRWSVSRERAVLLDSFPKGSKMRRFLRGKVDNGRVTLSTGAQASGALSALLGCNCLIELPVSRAGVDAGEEVWVYRL